MLGSLEPDAEVIFNLTTDQYWFGVRSIQERAMIAETVWTKEMEFEGHSESGHSVVFDAGDRHANGPSPMEAVLLALCSCTSVDVVSILKKKREPLASLTVSATAEQSAAPPRVFTKILLTYRIGGAVSKKAAEDAVDLSTSKSTHRFRQRAN